MASTSPLHNLLKKDQNGYTESNATFQQNGQMSQHSSASFHQQQPAQFTGQQPAQFTGQQSQSVQRTGATHSYSTHGQSPTSFTASGQNQYSSTQYSSTQGKVVDVRVVGHERGVERLISTTEVAAGERIINERVTQQMRRVPKKIVREEVVEKTIVIPEVIQIEEWVDEEIEVEDRVIEVAKIIQVEKVVEVPEIEIIEKIIEVPEVVIREKIREVPRIETVERIVEVPVIQVIEKIVEVPQIEYRDVPTERVVEVPEIVTEEIPREVAIPQYVDRPVEQVRVTEESYAVERKIPIPVEAETVVEYALPHIRPKYTKRKFPVYLPRFVEVPIAKQFADSGMLQAAETYCARVANLTAVKPAVALSEIELLATEIKDADLVNRHSLVTGHRTMKDLYAHAWETGNFEYFGSMGHSGVVPGVTTGVSEAHHYHDHH
eukprot:GHVH01005596.1.p1 GENE.GHVH01005596.1~~GHVH01005596.1.p1  ORF type:complete len:435 (+),score=86.16 GHVH01005596.1:182-1486(+)